MTNRSLEAVKSPSGYIGERERSQGILRLNVNLFSPADDTSKGIDLIDENTMASTPKKLRADGTHDADAEFLEQIDAFQNEIDALNEKASEEILKVEQKYNKLRKPFVEKRNEIIQKIPNFWITAFINHSQISTILQQEEVDCLHYLTNVDVEESEDIKSGYRLHFHFASNPFFENTLLTKEFCLGGPSGPMSKSTTIEWKDGKDISKSQLKQKQDDQQANKRKRHYETKTFFDWFSDNSDPVNDDIAELFKDDLLPNPLQYYLVPDIEVETEENDNSAEECEDEEQGNDIELAGNDADDAINDKAE